jgi:cell division protein FtsI (penicillin-binding protein 3)
MTPLHGNRHPVSPDLGADLDKVFRKRLRLVILGFALFGLAIIGKAFKLQVLDHQSLTMRAVSQYQQSVTIPPTRGIIYDRRGRELAANVDAPSVYAEPAKIEDKEGTAAGLARALDLPLPEVKAAIQTNRGFAWIKRLVSPQEAAAVGDLRLAGVGLYTETRRFYPRRDLASQLIGFAGIDSQGQSGLELSYDSYLKGAGGRLVVQRDARRRAISAQGFEGITTERGHNLVLTLDQNIQHFAQQEIRVAVEEARAKEGMVVVIDPVNGDLLALALATYFNPNCKEDRREKGRWQNVCLTHVFEPGSTMKPFIAAAALEEKLVTPDTVFDCGSGSITIHGKTIEDTHAYSALPVRDIIAKSSNVGAIRVGATLGRAEFHRWLTSFGFGEATGIDLGKESRGILRSPAAWSGLSQASMSIGQEIGVTPLQMVRAYAALANGGILPSIHVGKEITREGRVVKRIDGTGTRRVISPETARQVREALCRTVTEGTGQSAAVPGYTVAGKTGTAQKSSPSGGYARGKYLASFVGFVPAEAPAVVILVMVDEPVGAYYGGSVAAPVFARIAQRVMHYLAIPPHNLQELYPASAGGPGGSREG